VTVDTDFTTISGAHVENIHDSHHMLKSSTGHIFPTLIKAMNSMFVEIFRNVTETYIGNDPVSTVWMFSGFLQIQNCDYFLLLELLVNVELLD